MQRKIDVAFFVGRQIHLHGREVKRQRGLRVRRLECECERRVREARDVEAKFMTMTGKPFSSLRYFSHEEAADDSSVRSLIEMGLDGEGGPRMLLKIDAGLEAAQLLIRDGLGQAQVHHVADQRGHAVVAQAAGVHPRRHEPGRI